MVAETHLDYVGNELEIFALARQWKAYFARALKPYINGAVAEVGAGLGTTTETLCDPVAEAEWLCIEPDAKMAQQLRDLVAGRELPPRCAIHGGFIRDLSVERKFDTVIYIDVLEHIEDDQREFNDAAAHLRVGGRIIILAPAWPHLYSPFDRKIGHHRRYTRRTLGSLVADGLEREASFYLDSVGYLASLMNRVVLKQGLPTRSQILMWDRLMIPASRVIDPLILWSFGRSVVSVWVKKA